MYKTLSNAFGDLILSKILKMSEHWFKIVSTKRSSKHSRRHLKSLLSFVKIAAKIC